MRLVVCWVIPLGDIKDYIAGRYYRLLARDPDAEDVRRIVPDQVPDMGSWLQLL